MISLLFKKTTELEKKIGYRFKSRALLEEAMTHRSSRFENAGIDNDNERLEFLGDAVLGMIVSAHLFNAYQDVQEGLLTSMRSQIASGRMLADIARDSGLGEYLKLGKGEEGSGGRKRSSLLANTLEALLGAAYVDGGMKAADKIFAKVIQPHFQEITPDIWADNPKGKLQEYSQRKWKSGPEYSIVSREGPAHNSVFKVQVKLPDGSVMVAKGQNKRIAESAAARMFLRKLRV